MISGVLLMYSLAKIDHTKIAIKEQSRKRKIINSLLPQISNNWIVRVFISQTKPLIIRRQEK